MKRNENREMRGGVSRRRPGILSYNLRNGKKERSASSILQSGP